MPPKGAPKKRSRSAPPTARASTANAFAPVASSEPQDLEELPDGKGYDSLDENDGPPRSSEHLLVIDDEAALVGLDEYAPKESPDGEPPAKAAAAPAVAAASAASAAPAAPTQPGSPPRGAAVAAAARPVSSHEAAAAMAAGMAQGAAMMPAARPSPTRAAVVATGAPAAEKKLTEAQEKALKSQSQWLVWDVKQNTSTRFGRPEFKPYKDGLAPDGFVPTAKHDVGGPPAGHGFTSQTHPAIFVAAQGFDAQMFGQLEDGTNEYAASKGAGKSTFWKEWKPFTAQEIMGGCGLLLRAGVAPTPQVELVFKDPSLSFIWGDDRVRKAWSGEGCGGSARRFVQFRSFLHIQNWNESEYKTTDPETGEFVKLDWKSKGPMAKCEPLMSYVRYKWSKGWLPGKNLSLDEMTLGFKGRCAMVTRIKYKKEGDGFQCDCICEDGYCITFWFRCDTAPRVVPKDVSDRDDRCAWLVEQLPGAWYHLWMDNLFTSYKFGTMLAKRQCLFGGTCQTAEWRGLHNNVIQKEATSIAALAAARGTVKISHRPMTEYDTKTKTCTPVTNEKNEPIVNCEVICCSYFEENKTKPFHMMTNITECVEILELWRRCVSSSTGKVFYVKFLRLSVANLYNNNMNSVDIGDQLRNIYRPDGLWFRMRKWWWAVFLWAMGQSVVNAYLVYKRVCEDESATPMSHLDFHVAVATAWCTTPQLILKPATASAAVPITPVAPGVRRGRTKPQTADSSTPTKPTDAAPKQKRLTAYGEKTKATFVARYQSNPSAHVPVPPQRDAKASAKDCQVCNAGFGPFKGPGRFQKKASMACECCTVHVCSGECWQILHGTYKGGFNLLPDLCEESDGEDEANENGAGGDDEDEGQSEDDEQCAEILRGFGSSAM